MIARTAGWLVREARSVGARQSGVTLLGSVGRLGLGFVASVLLARTLGPAGYGLIALLSLVLSVVDTVADFGLTYTAVHKVARAVADGVGRAMPLASGYWSLTLLLNSAATVLGLVLAAPIAAIMGRPEAASQVRLVLLGLLTVAGSGAVTALLQATRRFGRLALLQVGMAATYLVAILALNAAGQLGVEQVVLLGVLNPLVGLIVGVRLLPPGLLRPSVGFTAPGRHVWRELAGFSRWLWVSSVLSLLAGQLDLALVGRWLPSVEVGLYALALNLATKLDILNQARFTVLLPNMATLETSRGIRGHALQALWRSIVLGAPFAVAVPLAEPFVRLVYGPEYVGAVPVLLVLILGVVFDLLTTPMLVLAFPLNAPRVLAGSDVLRLATLGLLCAALIPSMGPLGAAVAKLAAKLAGAAFTLVALWWIAVRPARSPRTDQRSAPT